MVWRRGRAYSQDLRERVMAALDRGMPVYEAAPLFGVSVSYIYKALIRRRETGEPGAARPSCRVPSSRHAARLLTGDPVSLDDAGRPFAATLRAIAPGIRAAADLVGASGRTIRGGDADAFDAWLDAASATPLRPFAEGLRADRQAVRAAIAEPLSNGPVEGQINRLKLIKRRMFGRAKFDLLRQRVLHAV